MLALPIAILLAGCGGDEVASVPAATAGALAAFPSATTPAAAPESPVAARDAELIGPTGLAFDTAGNLYISDCAWTFASVHRVDSNGMMTTFAGTGAPGFTGDGGPATSAQLYCPAGIAFGPDGALYVADHVNNRVRRIDGAGTITTYVGSGPDGLNLGRFSGDGGQATKATLQEPFGVAFDAAGDLFISDRDNNRIRKVDTAGVISTIAGNGELGYSGDGVLGSETSVEYPLGITVNAMGNVVFADPPNNRVRMIDSDGIITTIAGTGKGEATGDGGPAAKAAVADPENLVVDPSGNLYFTDNLHSTLRRIDARGIISTVAGNGMFGDLPSDGLAALDASLTGLAGVAMDAAGNLYLCAGTSVYRIDTDGVLTRFAGKA